MDSNGGLKDWSNLPECHILQSSLSYLPASVCIVDCMWKILWRQISWSYYVHECQLPTSQVLKMWIHPTGTWSPICITQLYMCMLRSKPDKSQFGTNTKTLCSALLQVDKKWEKRSGWCGRLHTHWQAEFTSEWVWDTVFMKSEIPRENLACNT
jgi:hypothetical protein